MLDFVGRAAGGIDVVADIGSAPRHSPTFWNGLFVVAQGATEANRL